MSKRIISCFLLITIMLNFILISPCRAEGTDPDTRQKSTPYKDPLWEEGKEDEVTIGDSLIDKGTAQKSETSSDTVSTSASSYGVSIMGFLVGIISRVINVFVLQIDLMLAFLTKTEVEGEEQDNENNPWLTIDKIVFNRIAILNINYMKVPPTHEGQTYNVGEIVIHQNQANVEVKKQVAKVYYVCRIIALIMSLGVLIYIGIRMAISTVSSEQAKYKKMLISWFESIIILAFMIYIMAGFIYLGEALTGVFYNIRTKLISSDSPILGATGNAKYGIFEDTIRTNTLNFVMGASGVQLAFWSIVYWAMLYMIAKFFWIYLKRFFIVGFLIMISPFITITYSIDKAGDNQAQAFGEWIKEFSMNVLIQPLHALLYMIFVMTANAIAVEAPLVGIIFMFAMTQGEKLVKRILKVGGMTMKGMEEIRLPGKKG